MLKKLYDKYGMKESELLIIFIVFIIACVVVIYIGTKNISKVEDNSNTISIKDIFDSVGENYSINIIKNEDDVETKLSIKCDEYVCFYSSDLFSNDEIIEYNDKWYALDIPGDYVNSKIIETNNEELLSNFNKVYYNLKLIVSFIEVSNRQSMDYETINATVSLERYLKEYNYMYKETNTTDEDVSIPITISVTDSSFDKIKIEYKDVDKYFNNTSYNTLTYTIDLRSLNTNDFSSAKEYFDEYYK